jgi:SAM-dependent methyltransferase
LAESFAGFQFAGWERAASTYDATWAGLTRLFVPSLLEAAGAGPGTRLLDVACGPGYVTAAATHLGATAVGVDFSPTMVRLARERHPRLTFETGNAEALPYPDRSFDAVAMGFALSHLPHPERGLCEAARVLRPGGRYAFTVWAGPEESPADRVVEAVVEEFANLDVPLPAGPLRFGFGSIDEAGATLAGCGFRADSVAVRSVNVTWRIASIDFLFDAERHGGVRMAGLLAAQTPEVLRQIHRALDERLASFRVADGIALPYTAHVVSATL